MSQEPKPLTNLVEFMFNKNHYYCRKDKKEDLFATKNSSLNLTQHPKLITWNATFKPQPSPDSYTLNENVVERGHAS